ncbi:deoxynucleoside monophosphate kinase [Acinetobacter phage AM101]|uniref:Deoxynucleoside monophosphate kinase n=1 Tax=Acinetobacter phage AM101 TaxID=2178927 RepID=A0A4Y1NKT1_9CAUD|nr:deoxynucleoside monophosphate kinase [Acinetobacter phage AM101]AWY10278.1 deoxynucleoside monophosphate kinase [Acinetobacter phage AM101]UYL85924.1 deoxy nucleotide monophosphate kinase [Acinetobacter phage vB_AbaM_DP45]
MTIVSIVGKKRSGKDTMADYMVEELGAVKYALALPIKKVLFETYSELNLSTKSGLSLSFADFNGDSPYDRESPLILSNSDVNDWLRKCIKILIEQYGLRENLTSGFESYLSVFNSINRNIEPWTVRRLMQILGTDLVCEHYDKYFWLRLMMNQYITEFANGAKIFIVTDIRQQHEIDFMRFINARLIFVERDSINTITNTDNHITEAGLQRQPGDPVIHNDGTLEEFKQKISNLFHTEVLQNDRR